MSSTPTIGVIGGGIFGVMNALYLDKAGFNVILIERLNDILMGASKNNQNRLHLGYHYPRSPSTAQQCISGFEKFIEEFPNCTDDSFLNAYFIAREGSHTSVEDYFKFCDTEGLPYDRIDPDKFQIPLNGISAGLTCPERVYDAELLRSTLKNRFSQTGITLKTGFDIEDIHRTDSGYKLLSFSGQSALVDAVVNCSYASNNGLAAKMGFSVSPKQFEYTVIPIIKAPMKRVGVTIMDGNFMTLLPYGKSDEFLLYHVGNSVVETEIAMSINHRWLDKETSPFSKIDKTAYADNFLKECQKFLPSLGDATITGFLEGPRVVLAKKENSDERPSIIDQFEPRYLSVFSGKIDHCVWVAADIRDRLEKSFNY